MNKFLLIVGVGSILYHNYKKIFKWGNNCYKRWMNAKCLMPSYVNKVVYINDHIYYYVTLSGEEFITKNKEYNLDKYTLLRKNKSFNSPDDILEADIITNDDIKIDVLSDIKLLCGPYIEQLSNKNKEWIFNYLVYEYYELLNINQIKSLNIALINGASFKLIRDTYL